MNLLSVAEYASLNNISQQAVYKQIRAKKLDVVEQIENGKRVKKIKVELNQVQQPIEPRVEEVENQDFTEHLEAEEVERLNKEEQPQEQPVKPTEQAEEKSLESFEAVFSLLKSQLEEKDLQISKLQAQIERQAEDNRTKDKVIQDQLAEINRLFEQSQILQAQSNTLLQEKNKQEPEAEEINIPAEEPKKKRSFWALLFGE